MCKDVSYGLHKRLCKNNNWFPSVLSFGFNRPLYCNGNCCKEETIMSTRSYFMSQTVIQNQTLLVTTWVTDLKCTNVITLKYFCCYLSTYNITESFLEFVSCLPAVLFYFLLQSFIFTLGVLLLLLTTHSCFLSKVISLYKQFNSFRLFILKKRAG